MPHDPNPAPSLGLILFPRGDEIRRVAVEADAVEIGTGLAPPVACTENRIREEIADCATFENASTKGVCDHCSRTAPGKGGLRT